MVPDIRSEDIEPFAVMLIGRMWARVEAASEDRLEHELQDMWFCLRGLEKVAIAVRTATHFNIAIGNHVRDLAEYIKDRIGVDPVASKWG